MPPSSPESSRFPPSAQVNARTAPLCPQRTNRRVPSDCHTPTVASCPAEASRRPSGLQDTSSVSSDWPQRYLSTGPGLPSACHNFTSSPPVASHSPFGLQDTDDNQYPSFELPKAFPAVPSLLQNRNVPSRATEASCLPRGCHATEKTGCLCPSSTGPDLPSADHRRTDLSQLADASCFPSGLQAKPCTECWCPLSTGPAVALLFHNRMIPLRPVASCSPLGLQAIDLIRSPSLMPERLRSGVPSDRQIRTISSSVEKPT